MGEYDLRAVASEKPEKDTPPTAAGNSSRGKLPIIEIELLFKPLESIAQTLEKLLDKTDLNKEKESMEQLLKMMDNKPPSPAQISSWLYRRYSLPSTFSSAKAMKRIVMEKVKDPDHQYFIIRYYRDKKLVNAFYTLQGAGLLVPTNSHDPDPEIFEE